MKRRKPKIGETLFLVDIGNRARDGRGKQRECIVSKIGRKYFYIDSWYEISFTLDGWIQHTNCCADFALYESEQEWVDACLTTKYRDAIREAFTYRFGDDSVYNATLSQLKQIAEILGITLEEDKT